jgi:hypothetical protein
MRGRPVAVHGRSLQPPRAIVNAQRTSMDDHDAALRCSYAHLPAIGPGADLFCLQLLSRSLMKMLKRSGDARSPCRSPRRILIQGVLQPSPSRMRTHESA